jgi:hypothetical protein
MDGSLNADDLMFASVRARYLESPGTVAARLRDAARQPGGLEGVRPGQALVAAGRLLTDAGELGEAVTILRTAVDLAPPAGDDHGARIALAIALALSGDSQPAEVLFRGGLSDKAGRGFGQRVQAALALAEAGQEAEAVRWADAALEHATKKRMGRQAEDVARKLRGTVHAHATGAAARRARPAAPGAGGAGPAAEDPGDDGGTGGSEAPERTEPGGDAAGGADAASAPGAPGAEPGQDGGARAADDVAAGTVADPPALAAAADGSVRWWPQSEYLRLARQLPDLAGRIGPGWAGHTARTEAGLRARASSAPGRIALVAADFGQFATYLRKGSVDPRDPGVLTGYAAVAAANGTPAAWPPRALRACWCGSGRRYRNCCAVTGPAIPAG